MRFKLRQGLCFAGALFAAVLSNSAHAVLLTATLNAAQEPGGSTSGATGTALMNYDVAANSYTLTVTLNNFPNSLVSSGLAEAAAGAAGSVVNDLGSEAAVYTRSGNTLTATFSSTRYSGTPVKLLQKGAYLNFASAAFPSGEIRGQLIAQRVKLTAMVTSAQEIPATRTSGVSPGSGAAYILYDPSTNTVNTRISIYNFTNTLTASHYHEDPVGLSGPVVLNFGSGAAYVQNGATLSQVFNQTYSGNPVTLLTNGAYINFHSTVYPAGEIRGQVLASTETLNTRILNGSTLGTISKNAPLTSGFIVTGGEPIMALITARGPSLAAFGVGSTLPDPQISLYGAGGVLLATNTGFASSFDVATITKLVNFPLVGADSAVMVVLPPGNYTVQLTSASGASGVAMEEVFDAR
jgi:hypothetical protein